MAREFTFGADPERLKRLLFEGLEETERQEDVTKSLSDHTTKSGGEWIGRYRLVRTIGEGGMGIVYLAEQHEPIRRKVALKVIKPGMDSKRVMARFEAERQALALLDHPNIAHVYDAGTTEAGRPYFVMEYVKGLSVTEHCDQHKLTINDRLRLFQQVCQAVQHAHQKGIIHRDIKPSNILVSMEADRANPKIIDFGVAKALAQPLTERTLATEDSQLLGTPEYMSPEQADMASVDIDTRSDIYSLGVLLYVLLTGILPFDSDTLREGGIERIRQVIRETDPKTPSTRLMKLGEKAKAIAQNRQMEIQTLARNLRKELEWIPLKAMRKDRAERYQSASELAEDIRNYLTGNPLIAGPPSKVYQVRKFVRRNRILVGGIATVLLVLIAGIVVSTIFAVGQARAHAEAQSVADFLRHDLLESVSPTKAKDREITILSFLDTASGNLKAKFEKEPLVEASIRDTLGNVYRHLGEYRSAELHLEHARRLYQEHLGMEDRRTLKSMGGLFWVYFEQGRYIEAEEIAVKGFEISRRVLGEEDEDTLDFMNTVAFAYLQMGCYEESELLYKKLLEICHRVLGEEERLTLSVIGNLPWVYLLQRRYDEAEKLFNKALELQRRVWGEEHPWTLVRMSNLAGVYHGQGRYNKAERQYLKTLETQRRVIGEEHVYTLWSMNGLAQLYTDEGRYEEAEHHFLKTLHICRRVLGEKHPDTLNNLNCLAVLYMKQDDFDKAEPLFLEALEGRRLKLGDTHPHTLESWNNLIELYEAWNKPEKADRWRAKLPQTEAINE